MEGRYLEIEREVIRRRRWLNTLSGLRMGVTFALILTVIYLVSVELGLLGMILPWWTLLALNCLAAWIGARWGRNRPMSLQRDLYLLDRAFALHERLSTIYELRQRSGSTDFLRALYRRTQDLVIHPHKALSLTRQERRGWVVAGSLMAACLLFLGLWFAGIPTLQMGQWLSQGPEATSSTIINENRTKPEQPISDSNTSSPDARTQVSSRPGDQPRSTCVDRDSIPKLSSEEQAGAIICEDISQGSTPTPSASPTKSQRLSQALAELKDQLDRGELSWDELKEQLEQLAQGATTPQLQEALQQAAKANTTEQLQRQLDEALSQLQDQLSEQQQASDSATATRDGRDGAQGNSSQQNNGTPGTEDGSPQQTAQQGEDSTSANQQTTQATGTGPQGQDNDQDGQSPAEQASNSEQGGKDSESTAGAQNSSSDSQSPSAQGAESQAQQMSPSGDAAGQEPGQEIRDSSATPSVPLSEKLFIHGGLLPRDPNLLERMLTRGIPVDLSGLQADGTPSLRLNLQRVEALLQSRDLPPELRNLVRAYFLAIAGGR